MTQQRFILHPSSFILCLLVLVSSSFAQMSYDPGDWTSYKDFRYALSVDVGAHELYVATTGGILSYNIMNNTWYDPVVMGYGLSEAVEFDDPMMLLFDGETNLLWVATRTQLLQCDVLQNTWRRTARDVWGPLDRVVDIGVAGGNIYVETIPGQVYSTLFNYSPPIPIANWERYITRYKGSRTFGNLMSEPDVADVAGIRWRGLRARVPLKSENMYGDIGSPPANFPSFFVKNSWLWTSDGTLHDPQLRTFPISDWITDEFGNLWTAQWGAGIMRADLRTLQAQIYSFGPAGNDIRTMLLDQDYTWVGGLNSGENLGISYASVNLKNWRTFTTREESKIHSTEVYDFAHFDHLVWIATNEGLLSYQEKEQQWTRYGVSKNLHSDEIRALVATDSELWIGTTRGLAVMTLPTHEIWRISNPGIELAGVLDLAICNDTIYAGTPNGWFKGSLKERTLKYTPLDPGLVAAAVPDISILGTDVWTVTPQGVMVYHSNDGTSKSWLAQVWLDGATPRSILATDKFVWVGTTERGLYRYKKSSGEWISYTKKDGLVDNHVQVIRQDGDDLLIGTTNGFTRFYWNRPDKLR